MPYFTTAELRALPDLYDTTRFPDPRLESARDWIVSVIERECGTSFLYSEHTQTLTGNGTSSLFLLMPYVRSVESITVDDVAFTPDELEAVVIRSGAIYYPNGACWPATTQGNVVVAYTAGWSATVPVDLKETAMRAARNWLLTSDAWSGTDSRATSITNDYGNITIAVAGPDRPTGLPDVDSTIMAWARRVKPRLIAVG